MNKIQKDETNLPIAPFTEDTSLKELCNLLDANELIFNNLV